jgi:hypothetical protein
MNPASANPPLPEPTLPLPESEGWSWKKMFYLVTLAVAAHVALIFVFGTKKQFVPKPVTEVPRLQFANRADELLELDNPTLFALPNPRDFAAAIWQQPPTNRPPSFRWQAKPGELPLPDTENLGAAFVRFMQTNVFGDFQPDFKPAPPFAELAVHIETALPQQTTLQLSGALADRPLLRQPALPSLEWKDIIAPSRVQVLVGGDGTVISAVLLPPDSDLEAAGRASKGDTNAVVLARSLKFAPAAQLVFGEVTFHWHTTPLPGTNAPANP